MDIFKNYKDEDAVVITESKDLISAFYKNRDGSRRMVIFTRYTP